MTSARITDIERIDTCLECGGGGMRIDGALCDQCGGKGTMPVFRPLDPFVAEPAIPLFSRWRHVEGEEVVVVSVEREVHKDVDGSWVDLVVYGVPALQCTKTRTRANFLARFAPAEDEAMDALEGLEAAVSHYIDADRSPISEEEAAARLRLKATAVRLRKIARGER